VTEKHILVERTLRNLVLLRKINKAALSVAVLVYVGLLAIAVTQDIAPLIVFSTCILLAEILVFQFVRTITDFIEHQL
jgi:hypothetical protein